MVTKKSSQTQKASQSQNSPQNQKSSSSNSSSKAVVKTVFIPIKQEIIQQKAFEISKKGLSWDQLNWILGEDELKIANAIEGENKVLSGALPPTISINPTKIVQKPKVEDVKKMAEMISQRHMPLPQLHWELAIREHIINSLKE